jgi:carbon-monoxide dehydrogenase medium subunit
MKPASFQYEKPGSLAEALDTLARYAGGAKVLAGGQSLVPILNMRLAKPTALIDLGALAELRGVARSDNEWRIRSMTTQAELERTPGLPPALADAVRHIAHPQIRSRGTVGGSLAHMDPLAEWPAVGLAFGVRLLLASASGVREVSIDEFIVGALTTCLREEEILIEVRLPAKGARQAFAEIARRPGDFALVGSVCHWPDGGSPSLVVFGAGSGPIRLPRTEAALSAGLRGGRDLVEMAHGEIQSGADLHVSADYRRRAASWLVDRVVRQACESGSR